MRAGNLPLAMKIYDRGRNEDCAVKSAGHGYCFKVWRTSTPPVSIQRSGCLGLRFGVARISRRRQTLRSSESRFTRSCDSNALDPCDLIQHYWLIRFSIRNLPSIPRQESTINKPPQSSLANRIRAEFSWFPRYLINGQRL